MTLEQSINIIRQICEQVSLPLAGHQQVQQALSVLQEAIKPVETNPEL
jgi:hypothetical protein